MFCYNSYRTILLVILKLLTKTMNFAIMDQAVKILEEL